MGSKILKDENLVLKYRLRYYYKMGKEPYCDNTPHSRVEYVILLSKYTMYLQLLARHFFSFSTSTYFQFEKIGGWKSEAEVMSPSSAIFSVSVR